MGQTCCKGGNEQDKNNEIKQHPVAADQISNEDLKFYKQNEDKIVKIQAVIKGKHAREKNQNKQKL